MRKNLGLPYMGSKSKIAEKLLSEIIKRNPEAEIFIDLFAGGCAMSHAALINGAFKKVYANDINKAPQLFKDVIDGKYRDNKQWISRYEFFKLRDDDEFVKSVWTFGNNGNSYLYGKHLEPYKKAYHYARILNDFSLFNEFSPYIEKEFNGNLKKYIKNNQERIKQDYIKWYSNRKSDNLEKLKNISRLERLQHLERFQRLQELESLKDLSEILEISQGSYQDFKLPSPDLCVIYCDIPYKGTKEYYNDGERIDFGYNEFYDWVREKSNQGYSIFISEYECPDDFKEVLSIDFQSSYSSSGVKKTKERLYTYKD